MNGALSPNDIGAVIKQHGAKSKLGWIAKYAQLAGDPYAPWVTKSGNQYALHKSYDAPRVSELEQIVGVKEDENSVLSILSTEHLDRYKDITVQAGIDKSLYNGVVLDTHNLSSVENILAHCTGLYDFAFPGDGVPALAWMVEYDTASEKNRNLLAMDKAGKIPACSIAYFIDTFEIDNESGVQTILTSKMYEGSKCAVGVNPYASVARSLTMKAIDDSVAAGILKADAELVREAKGIARTSIFIPPQTKKAAPKQASATSVTDPRTPGDNKLGALPALSQTEFESQLTDLLTILSIFSDTEMLDFNFTEVLKSMPGLTAEQQAHIAKAVGEKAIAHHKEAVKAIHDAIKEGMAHREDAYAKEEEAEGMHDKADACHAEALKHAKGLLGDANDEGKKDAPKKEEESKKDSLSPRERAKQRAAQNIEATAATKTLELLETISKRLSAVEAAPASANVLAKFE